MLEELNLRAAPQQIEMIELSPATDTEAELLRHISREPMHIDEVCRESGLPASTVSSLLAMMELKGLVKEMGAQVLRPGPGGGRDLWIRRNVTIGRGTICRRQMEKQQHRSGKSLVVVESPAKARTISRILGSQVRRTRLGRPHP